MTTAQTSSGGGPGILWEDTSHCLSPKVPFGRNVFFGGSPFLPKIAGTLGGLQMVLTSLLCSLLPALMTFLGRPRA